MSTKNRIVFLIYLGLTFIGFLFVTYPLFYFLGSFTVGPDYPHWTSILSVFFSLIAAVLYINQGHPLRHLRAYVISFILLAVLLGTTVTLLRAAFGLSVSNTVFALLFVFVYLISYYLIFRSGQPELTSS